jgi:hypothetical protein
MLTFRDRRVQVGRDVALVACDQTSLLELVEPPPAMVAADAQRVGLAAAELLLEMLMHGAQPSVVSRLSSATCCRGIRPRRIFSRMAAALAIWVIHLGATSSPVSLNPPTGHRS